MNRLIVDPSQFDVWSAFPAYYAQQHPFYLLGDVATPTVLIEVKGVGIVAEADVLLVETTTRPDDAYWKVERTDVMATYSLVDLLQLDFQHPLLRSGMYDEETSYETLKQKWDAGYGLPSSHWTKQDYAAHLQAERHVPPASTTVCEACQIDLVVRYGQDASRLLERHVTETDAMWLCPTCHKARHLFN